MLIPFPSLRQNTSHLQFKEERFIFAHCFRAFTGWLVVCKVNQQRRDIAEETAQSVSEAEKTGQSERQRERMGPGTKVHSSKSLLQ